MPSKPVVFSSLVLVFIIISLLKALKDAPLEYVHDLTVKDESDTISNIGNGQSISNDTIVNDVMTFTNHNVKPTNPPKVTNQDIIYDHSRNTPPIVNEEHKIIFFQVAKVASSEWTRFFLRLGGHPNWCGSSRIHDTTSNGLKYLHDFGMWKATKMMVDPTWTKAIFVRHPKPRLLSAFLDKAISKSNKFETKMCEAYAKHEGKSLNKCKKNHEDLDFFLREITTTMKDNVHWRSIYSRVDEKWWPYINFVGYKNNMSEDARTLLESIHSRKTGISAWAAVGKSGWSDNERDCASTMESEGEFLSGVDKMHFSGARDKMLKYYTPELENFVEDHYRDDLHNRYFHFEPIKLFGTSNDE